MRISKGSFRIYLLSAAALLLGCWLWARIPRVLAEPGGMVRLIVCSAIAAILLFRPADSARKAVLSRVPALWLGVAGVILSVGGLILTIHQLEWIGILITAYACLAWASPERLRQTAPAALFVLYWVHPLPAQIAWPIQGVMQRLSLHGSQFLLHFSNVPAWVNDLVIHGLNGSYEIPRACSGMRTASTVFACALGAGVLLRLSWRSIAFFTILGLVQAVALNIIRISIMVAHAVPGGDLAERLHDTTGGFLLFAILLVQFEMAMFAGRRPKKKAPGQQHGGLVLSKTAVAITLVAVAVLAATGVRGVTQSTPAHRAAMFMRVAEADVHVNTAVADGASRAAVALMPGRVDYRLARGKVLLAMDDPRAALKALEPLPSEHDMRVLEIRLQALVAAGYTEEARGILAGLDSSLLESPAIELARAEMAAHEYDIDRVVERLAHVRAKGELSRRVRRFFPLLASQDRWGTIYRCDIPDSPYSSSERLLLGVTACLIGNDYERAGEIMENNVSLWKRNAAFSAHLLMLARQRPEDGWKEHYRELVMDELPKLHPDAIPFRIDSLKVIEDEDTAQQAFAFLKSRDPEHPGISFLSLRYPDLHAEGHDVSRRDLLERTLNEFAKRKEAGTLTFDGILLYVDALHLAGKHVRANAVLKSVEQEYLGRLDTAILHRIAARMEQSKWSAHYELLRAARLDDDTAWRIADVPLATALLRSGYPMYAAEIARHGLRVMPNWKEMAFVLARILASEDRAEEALSLLRPYTDSPSPIMEQLFRETGRFTSYRKTVAMLDKGVPEITENPSWTLPPAERVIARPASETESDELVLNSGVISAPPSEFGLNPFFRDLRALVRETRESGEIPPLSRWYGAGRDCWERTAAVHHAAMFHIQKGDYDGAMEAVEVALRESPRSVTLWRLLIRLKGGAPGVVKSAAEACPEDPVIWLACVVLVHRENDTEALQFLLGEGRRNETFPPGTLIRAAEYLLRQKEVELADNLVREAVRRDPEYVPAYLVGMHCACSRNDFGRAVSLAEEAADLCPDPTPFWKTVVRLTMAQNADKDDLVPLLENLARQFPEEPEWAARLGCAHLGKGDPQRAWLTFAPLVHDAGESNIPPSLVTRMAEAARQCGHRKEAIGLLEEAHRRTPDDVHVLNNLVYVLNQSDGTRRKARALLPQLLKLDDSVETLDTAAQVLHLAGETKDALSMIERAMKKVAGCPLAVWREVHITAAEVYCANGETASAAGLLDTLFARVPEARKDPRVLGLPAVSQ